MRLAITDACIFIDLINMELLDVFFQLPFEMHTSEDILVELYDHQVHALRTFSSNNQLHIYAFSPEERSQIEKSNSSRRLSPQDKGVIFLANKLQAILLSSDALVRKTATADKIEVHGAFWILDKLLEHQLLDKLNAFQALEKLFQSNFTISSNPKLLHEYKQRQEKWLL